MPTHFHPLKINEIRKETPECISIQFEVPDELRSVYQFLPGQNITLRTMLNGTEIRRSYSICSIPDENELRVAVKLMDKGKFSGFAHTLLKAGDTLEVLPPSGRFYTPLNASNQKHYLALAAGSGITPVISLIKAVLTTEPQSHFTLLYGNKNRSSIIFKDQLDALKNKYINRFSLHHLLSREKTDISLYHGRLGSAKMEEMNGRLFNLEAIDEIFLCGPQEMIFGVSDWLKSKNYPAEKIHFELFISPGQAIGQEVKPTSNQQDTSGQHSLVTIKIDGIETEFPLEYESKSILDAAIDAGADLPYSCKGGVCATCRAKLLEGKVEMDLNYALEDDEIENGYILTCQSHPRTPVVKISFDE